MQDELKPSTSMGHSVARLRRPDGIFDLRIERSVDERGQATYSEALEACTHAELLAAWATLESVREILPDVARAVRTVLEATVLDPLAKRPPLPALTIAPPPRPHKATQANPRAYKGTKDRPPKPRRPAAVDLRGFLCVAGAQDRLVTILEAELGPIGVPSEIRDASPGYGRGFAYQYTRDAELWENARAWHHRLDLERDHDLRRALLFHFAPCRDPERLRWLGLLEEVQPARRLALVEALHSSGECPLPTTNTAEGLRALDASSTTKNFALRAGYFARAIAREPDAMACQAAFELANLHDPEHDFLQSAVSFAPVGSDRLPRLLAFCDGAFDEATKQAMSLWHASCLDLDFVEVLGMLHERRIPAATSREIAVSMSWQLLDKDVPHAFAPYLGDIRDCFDAIADVPDAYLDRASSTFLEYVYEDDYDGLSGAAPFLARTCREPLPKGGYVHVAIQQLTALEEEFIDRALAASDQSYAILIDATRRKNDAWMVAYGLGSLIEDDETFLDAFERHPRRLMRVAAMLGSLASTTRNKIVLQVTSSKLAVDLEACEAGELAAIYDEHGSQSVGTSPIPKKLREHIAGRVQLRDSQLDRITEKIRAAWPRVLLDRIEERTLEELSLSLGTRDVDVVQLGDSMLHAMRLQQDLDSNKRSLRRLMRACMRGDRDAVRTHPTNARWLAKQPPRIAENWLRDRVLVRELGSEQSRQKIQIAIEQDPLEALRLGTYVGSCLGLGGIYAYSAAAIALDINKQVVFARSEEGHFLARQVIALTKDSKLACYEIYPAIDDPELRRAFADFDRALAESMGVSIARSGHGDDEKSGQVEMIVAETWLDDELWKPGKDGSAGRDSRLRTP